LGVKCKTVVLQPAQHAGTYDMKTITRGRGDDELRFISYIDRTRVCRDLQKHDEMRGPLTPDQGGTARYLANLRALSVMANSLESQSFQALEHFK